VTIQLACLLIGALLPYIWAFSSLPFRNNQFGTVDLNQPRVQAEKLEDAGARVWGAQMNAWEALAVFTVANVAAFMGGVEPAGNWSYAALGWVVFRIGHGGFYIADVPAARVLCFVGATGMSIWIFVMGLMAS